MKYIYLAFSILFISQSAYSSIESGLFHTPEVPVYELDTDELISGSIEGSYKVSRNRVIIEAETQLLESANRYYMPTVLMTSHTKYKMDRPGHPEPYPEFSVDLSATVKLWSNILKEKKDNAYYNLLSAQYRYNESVNEVYNVIDENLLKIEASRRFLAKADGYRKSMNALLEKMNISNKSGLMKNSDRIFANVTLKKFDESLLNIQSQIESYISQINNITPYNLYNESYGVNVDVVWEKLYLHSSMFDINRVRQRNYGLLMEDASLKAEKNRVRSLSEDFSIDLVTQHNISENEFSSTKNEQNQAEYGYTYDDDGEAFIGIKLSYTGLNYTNYKNRKSEYYRYTEKMIAFDESIHSIKVELEAYEKQYSLNASRIENIDSQISLTIDAIKNQMSELLVDESNVLDVFRNISSLSDLEYNKLNTELELIGIVVRVNTINSIVPGHYVL